MLNSRSAPAYSIVDAFALLPLRSCHAVKRYMTRILVQLSARQSLACAPFGGNLPGGTFPREGWRNVRQQQTVRGQRINVVAEAITPVLHHIFMSIAGPDWLDPKFQIRQ